MSNYLNVLKQSGIRSMTMRCEELGGVNLGQGICDIPTPLHIKLAANAAINENYNTYAPYQGCMELRHAILKKLHQFNGILHPKLENILVTHGATGGFVSAVRAIFNPGDEAIIFEPFYGYHYQLLEMHSVAVKTILIDVENNFTFDPLQFERIINKKTKAIVLCNPSNPSGKVFTSVELKQIGDIANKYGLFIISDEIYEHIVYSGNVHTSLSAFDDYTERVIMLSGFSKTYHMTGWRIGYAYGPADIIKKMGLIHDLLYICPSTPLQHAVVAALASPEVYYNELIITFSNKRKLIVDSLQDIGFTLTVPEGAYYLIANYSKLELPRNSEIAANQLLERAKVSTVAGKYFYCNQKTAENKLRFCFAVSDEKIKQAIKQLRQYFLG